MLKKNKKEYIIITIFFFIILFLYLTGYPIPCIFHKITGLYCPGCGITRMFISILRLKFIDAFHYNCFAFILLIIFIILNLIKIITQKNIMIKNSVLYVIIALAIVFAILRNMPYFSWLSP